MHLTISAHKGTRNVVITEEGKDYTYHIELNPLIKTPYDMSIVALTMHVNRPKAPPLSPIAESLYYCIEDHVNAAHAGESGDRGGFARARAIIETLQQLGHQATP